MKLVSDGAISDPPGLEFYTAVGKDSHNFTIFSCSRGTNAVENVHLQMCRLLSIRAYSMGPEMANALLLQFLHRFNTRVREKHFPNYARPGHYNGILIDLIQFLHESVYDIPLYNNWVSVKSYESTGETFGFIPSKVETNYSAENINSLYVVDEKVLSKPLLYLAERTCPVDNKLRKIILNEGKVRVPCLKFSTVQERTVFKHLVPDFISYENFKDQMFFDKFSSLTAEDLSLIKKQYPKLNCEIGVNFFPKHKSHIISHYKDYSDVLNFKEFESSHGIIMERIFKNNTIASNLCLMPLPSVPSLEPIQAACTLQDDDGSVQNVDNDNDYFELITNLCVEQLAGGTHKRMAVSEFTRVGGPQIS